MVMGLLNASIGACGDFRLCERNRFCAQKAKGTAALSVGNVIVQRLMSTRHFPVIAGLARPGERT
jgi:hypothetical protein